MKSLLNYLLYCNNPEISVSVFRIAVLSLLLILQLDLICDFELLVGPNCLLDWEFKDARIFNYYFELSFYKIFNYFNIQSKEYFFQVFTFAFFTFLVLSILGYYIRLTLIVLCVLYSILYNELSFYSYGIDIFFQACLFILVLSDNGTGYSLDRIANKKWDALLLHKYAILFMRCYLCIIYFFGGFEKIMSGGWDNGLVMWYALTYSQFNVMDVQFVQSNFIWFKLFSYFVLIAEVGYPILIWFRNIRTVLVLFIIFMHIGISLSMKLHYFGLLLIFMNLFAWWDYIKLDLFTLFQKSQKRGIEVT